VALVLAILNAIVKPILILLTLPLTILTLGLFLFVINAVIILLAGSFIDGFVVDGFWWALLFSLLLSIITSLLTSRKKDSD
jgi:putative membrane protein